MEKTIKSLIQQVEMADLQDEHGHHFTNNQAFVQLKKEYEEGKFKKDENLIGSFSNKHRERFYIHEVDGKPTVSGDDIKSFCLFSDDIDVIMTVEELSAVGCICSNYYGLDEQLSKKVFDSVHNLIRKVAELEENLTGKKSKEE